MEVKMSYRIVEIRDGKTVVYPEVTNIEIAKKYFRIWKKDFFVYLLEQNNVSIIRNFIEEERRIVVIWRDKKGEEKFYSLSY